MQYVYCGEYGGGTGWNETGWVFRGDAKLAHSAVWLDVFVEGRDFCFWGGTRNWRGSAIPLGVFVSLWVE